MPTGRGDPAGGVGDHPGGVPSEISESATPSALQPQAGSCRVRSPGSPPGRPAVAPGRRGPGAALACGRAAAAGEALSPDRSRRSTLTLKWFQGGHVRFRVASAPPLICSCPLSSFFPILNVSPSSRFPCSVPAPYSSPVNALASYFSGTQKLLNKISVSTHLSPHPLLTSFPEDSGNEVSLLFRFRSSTRALDC